LVALFYIIIPVKVRVSRSKFIFIFLFSLSHLTLSLQKITLIFLNPSPYPQYSYNHSNPLPNMAKYPPPGAPGFSKPSMTSEAIAYRKEIAQARREKRSLRETEQASEQPQKRARRITDASMPSSHSFSSSNNDNFSSSSSSSVKNEAPEPTVASQTPPPKTYKSLPTTVPIKKKNHVARKRALVASFGQALVTIGEVWKEKAATMSESELRRAVDFAFPSINEPKPDRKGGRPKRVKEEARHFAEKLLAPMLVRQGE